MTKAEDKKSFPDKEYIVHIEDATRTIKMTYGLLQRLTSMIFDLTQLANLSLDSNLTRNLINECLDERDDFGDRKNPKKDFTLQLSLEEGEALSTWIMEHLMNFFISQLEAQKKAVEQLTPFLKTAEEDQLNLPLDNKIEQSM